MSKFVGFCLGVTIGAIVEMRTGAISNFIKSNQLDDKTKTAMDRWSV